MKGVIAIDVAVTTMTKVIYDNATNHGKKHISIDGVDGLFYIKQLVSARVIRHVTMHRRGPLPPVTRFFVFIENDASETVTFHTWSR